MTKYGIIYCPRHEGLKSVKKRRETIEASLKRHGLDYDLVQSENADSVERLVTMMIHNGYENIIICGGDSALGDAANCLMREEKEMRERICLGVIPNGVLNDFAKFWGFNDKDVDSVIESLKVHRVRRIDVGRMNFTDRDGKKSVRYFINCVNVGLIANIQKLRRDTRKVFWSRKLSFAISFFLHIFQRGYWKMQYTINYESESHRVMALCVGNAFGFGQTPNAVPYNGMLDVTVIRNSAVTHTLFGFLLFLRGKILNHKWVRPYRGRDVSLELPKNTPLSVDGSVLSSIDTSQQIKMAVEQETINFIIEK